MAYRIYRANNKGTGCASEWNIATVGDSKYPETVVFLSIAKQGESKGEDASFLWKESIKVKLGQNDIGELLATLRGRQPNIAAGKGLYHQSPKGIKIVNFNINEQGPGYYLRVSAQDENKKPLGNLAHGISNAEAEALESLLSQAIALIVNPPKVNTTPLD